MLSRDLTQNWVNELGAVHKRRQLFFPIFDDPFPYVSRFLVLYVGNFDQFFTLTPLPIANIVYGWPLVKCHRKKIQ